MYYFRYLTSKRGLVDIGENTFINFYGDQWVWDEELMEFSVTKA